MKRFVLALLLLSSASAALATSVSCPTQNSLAGEYETAVEKGFMPNKLLLRSNSDDSGYSVELNSYWAPKPFDDGTLGTVGNFNGELIVPQPWSCVALLEVRETVNASDESNAMVCVLLLRFIGASTVEVSALGQCEYFQGNRATPAGSYRRRRP